MKINKDIVELAKKIAIVAYPDTRDLVEQRAVIVLKNLHLQTLEQLEKELPEEREEAHLAGDKEERDNYFYNLCLQQVKQIITKLKQ